MALRKRSCRCPLLGMLIGLCLLRHACSLCFSRIFHRSRAPIGRQGVQSEKDSTRDGTDERQRLVLAGYAKEGESGLRQPRHSDGDPRR